MSLATRIRNATEQFPLASRRAPRAWLGGLFALALGCIGASNASADTLALMSGAGQSGLGGSQAAAPLVVAVRDDTGNPIAGRTIQWSTSNGFTLGAPSSVTGANGQASVTFTYGNYGTTTIVASDPVGDTSTQADETSIGSDSMTLVSGNNQSGKSGTSSTQPLVVQILNASGGAVVGRTVSWNDQTGFTHVNAPTSVTDGSGNASMGFTYLAGTPAPGGNAATIRAADAVSAKTVDFAMTVLGFDTISFVSGASQSGFVGATSAPVVAQVLDSGGNPVAGVTVNWSQTQGPAGAVSLSNASTVTDAAGRTSITFQYLLAGAGSITAQTAVTSSIDMHFSGTSAASLTLVSPDDLNGAAGSASGTPITVLATNADGTPAVGHTIAWSVISGDGTPGAPSSVTNGSGQASVGFTFGTVDTNFQASDATLGKTVIEHTSVTPTSTLRLVSGANQVGTINTGAAQPLVVQVLNAAGRPVIGRTINWSVAAGSSVAVNGPTSVTDATGSASMAFRYLAQAGVSTIQFQDATTGISNLATETATGLYAVIVVSGDGQSGLIGVHSAQPLVMQENDPGGNPVAGRTINWTTAGNIAFDAASSVTNASGQAQMGFTYGPSPSNSAISASDPLTVNAGTGSAHFVVSTVGSNTLSIISGNGQSGPGGSPGGQPLIVEVRDSSGNLVAGRTIHWATVAGSAAPTGPTSATGATGRASMTFTFGPNVAGVPTVSSMVSATDPTTGQAVQFAMTAINPQGHLQILSGNAQTGTTGTPSAQPIVVQLVDGNGQPVAGAALAWKVVSGSATLTAVTTTTDANGRITASFNFGPIPGTSVIQAYDPANPNGSLVQATESALAVVVQNLTIVSGNGQVVLGTKPSQPMVVQLTDAANAPVAGATIHWTTNKGQLASANSVTDAAGRASNTLTPNAATGAITVQASAPLASAPVTFTLNAGLSTIPGLTPPEQAVAGALDTTCPALAALTQLTPAQADLLARCKDLYVAGGIDPPKAADALGQIVDETAAVQSEAAVNAALAQYQNINLRLAALRSSSKTSSLNGLALAGPGGSVAIASLLDALFGSNAFAAAPSGDSGLLGSRWGFFATGTIGRGNADVRSMTPAYSYDINGLTAGLDYRFRDNWISGLAVGYSHQNSDLDHDAGHVRMSGWSLSTYSTLSFKNGLYLDGVLIWGNNSFDVSRRIDYTLPTLSGGTTSIDQVAQGHPGGNLFSAALTFGGDYHKNAWSFSPYAQLIGSSMTFDGYRESTLAAPGFGLALTVDSRDIHTFSGLLGTKIAYTQSTSWGVFVPTGSLEWQHAFNSPSNAVSAHFTADPTQTPFTLVGNPLENSFVRLGFGSSFVFTHGRSGFVLYEHTFGRNGMTQDNLSLGIRIEF